MLPKAGSDCKAEKQLLADDDYPAHPAVFSLPPKEEPHYN
jgi:hypothetical protein